MRNPPEVNSHRVRTPLFLATFGTAALIALGACGGESAQSEAPPEPEVMIPVLTLSEPLREIGDFEGTTDQTLDFVSDIVSLSDGLIAILDQGASQVLVFDDEGALVRRFGGEGDGPGEFRTAVDLRRRADDSLWVLDSRGMSVSQFSPDGEYVDELPASDLSGDETFPLDVFFHDRFWVDGALTPEERTRVTSVLDRAPFPRDQNGFRLVNVTDNGEFWIREELGSGTTPSRWIVLSADGSPESMVELPANFEAMEVGADGGILGRWRDEVDVNYVRQYQLEESGRTAPLPAWLSSHEAAPPPLGPAAADSMQSIMKGMMKNLATLQEINYSESYSYTTSVDSLFADAEIDLPEGYGTHVLNATSRGWAMVVTMQGYEGLCALAYGLGTPPGFVGGRLVCGD